MIDTAELSRFGVGQACVSHTSQNWLQVVAFLVSWLLSPEGSFLERRSCELFVVHRDSHSGMDGCMDPYNDSMFIGKV